MKMSAKVAMFCGAALFMTGSRPLLHAQDGPTNGQPVVTILWPQRGVSFSGGILAKIKASATNFDDSLAQVQFLAGTNLIGMVSNAPFNLLWQVLQPCKSCTFNLMVRAVDNLGAVKEAGPVPVYYYTGGPPEPIVEIVSARDGSIFAAPASFVYSAEVLASSGDAGPVEFFVGTNSVGLAHQNTPLAATTPPSSITVSNLQEGEYGLTVRYRGGNGDYCRCILITNTIRVVKLALHLPSLTPDGRIQFEVVTSFSGIQTIVQASSNFGDWIPVSTNTPSSNSFTFTEATPATNAQRFYRVLVPSENP